MARGPRKTHDVVVLGFKAADPGKYGRLVMDGDRNCKSIVEVQRMPRS